MSGRRAELRFERQYYQREYLEDLCERTVAEFCVDAYGQELVPLPTDALTQLIERKTSMLDLYARLDEGINGVTTMFSGNRLPCVEIAAELSRQWFRENRLRTTLAHEFGHVLLHAPLWRAQRTAIHDIGEVPIAHACRREAIEGNAHRDEWIEWQAGYVSGALLMSKRRVDRLVEQFLTRRSNAAELIPGSPETEELVEHVTVAFQVSRLAARVRLAQLGVVGS